MVKYLVENGANIKYKDKNGGNAINYALINDKIEVAQYLIGKGANVNQKYKNGKTCLQLACEKNLSKPIRFLLENGATFDLENPGTIKMFREILEKENIDAIEALIDS